MLRILINSPPKFIRTFTMSTAAMTKVSDAIINDHKEIKECYRNIKSAPDDDAKTRWRNQFVWELARHSIAEELVVYPAMDKYITSGGHEMAEKDREQHQMVIFYHKLS